MAVIEGAMARDAASVPPENNDRYLRAFLIRESLSQLRQEKSGDERLSLADYPQAPGVFEGEERGRMLRTEANAHPGGARWR